MVCALIFSFESKWEDKKQQLFGSEGMNDLPHKEFKPELPSEGTGAENIFEAEI